MGAIGTRGYAALLHPQAPVGTLITQFCPTRLVLRSTDDPIAFYSRETSPAFC